MENDRPLVRPQGARPSVLALALAPALMLALAGCNEPAPPTAVQGRTAALSLTQFAVLGGQKVQALTGAQVSGNVASRQMATATTVDIGAGVTVDGAVHGSRVKLGTGSVTGDLYSDGVARGAGAQSGATSPFVAGDLPEPPMDIFVVPSKINQAVPRGGTLELCPGNTGKLTVGEGGTLRLAEGVHYLGSLSVGKGAHLVAGGDVQIVISGKLTVSDGATLAGAEGRGLTARSLEITAGTGIAVGKSAQVRALLRSARDVTVGTGASVTGMIIGRKVTLGKGAVVSFEDDLDLMRTPPQGGLCIANERLAVPRYSASMALVNGTLWGWGQGDFAQISAFPPGTRIYAEPLLEGIDEITAGSGHTFFRKEDGTLWAFGDNWSGQIGENLPESVGQPVQFSALGDIDSLALGEAHTLALREDGTVWSWGNNERGQLGDGTLTSRAMPQQVPGLSDIKAVSARRGVSMALRADGTVWAWGENNFGQLGDGTFDDRNMPVQVANLQNVVRIVASYHSLALDADGTLWSWGYNLEGQLGDGTFDNRALPWAMPLIGVTNMVSGEGGHSLATTSDGAVWAWGDNGNGQLGDGTTVRKLFPVQVVGLSNAIGLAAGGGHSLALRNDGTLWAWGGGGSGQLGNGRADDVRKPAQVTLGLTSPAGRSVLGAFLGQSSNHSFVQRDDGSFVGMGPNGSSQLGDGTNRDRLVPVALRSINNVRTLIGGSIHSLLVKTDGTLWGWGALEGVDEGPGVKVQKKPVKINGVGMVVGAAVGNHHSLVVSDDGLVRSFGRSEAGELGNNLVGVIQKTPVVVAGLDQITAVAAGHSFSLALRQDGTVWSWGDNEDGVLGDGTFDSRATPAQIPSLSGITAIYAGGHHALAVKSDGTMWAWGSNGDGQLGDGTFNSSNTPVQVTGLSDVVSISVGHFHTLAVKADGTLWVWGSNEDGSLGLGDGSARNVPTQHPVLENVASAAAGYYHSLVVTTDGKIYGFGENEGGAFGNGQEESEESWPLRLVIR